MASEREYNNKSKVTKTELINTFSSIDMKINDLHKRSSEDFLQLNNYLKDYHRKTRIISENAFKVFETISGNKEIDLIKELEKIHNRLEVCREKIKEEDFRKIKVLKEIVLKSNQLNITLRNSKQDFITFKFIVTNYRLISNYEDLEIQWNKNLDIWNNEIEVIQKLLTSISNQVEVFKEQISSNIGKLEAKVENSLKVFHNLSKETKSNIGSVAQKSQDSKLQIPLLKRKTEDSSQGISNIITHLQYHDIIRQKIEHIQKTHYKIIDDLSGSLEKKNRDLHDTQEDYNKIGDIADLQSAQLLLVSKEYQNALSTITNNFQSITNDLTTISNISKEFSYNDNNSEITLLKQIKDQLDEGIISLDLNNFRAIHEEYSIANKRLAVISGQIKNDLQLPLNKLAKFDDPGNDDSGQEVVVPKVLKQIISLTNDIENKNREIWLEINEIQQLSDSIISEELESWGSQLEKDRIDLMVEISKILEALDKDNIELDEVLKQNRELNKNLIVKIEAVINRAEYYDYFENIIENVISQLNTINYRIKPEQSVESQKDKAANLKDITKTYTMESERTIHDNVVKGSEMPLPASSTDKTEEIEFF